MLAETEDSVHVKGQVDLPIGKQYITTSCIGKNFKWEKFRSYEFGKWNLSVSFQNTDCVGHHFRHCSLNPLCNAHPLCIKITLRIKISIHIKIKLHIKMKLRIKTMLRIKISLWIEDSHSLIDILFVSIISQIYQKDERICEMKLISYNITVFVKKK